MSDENLHDWMYDLDKKSLKKAVDVGEILPQLKPELNTVYHATIKSIPKAFTSDFGLAHSVEIEHEGMKKQIVMGKSFKFQLAVCMSRLGLDPTKLKDFEKLIGKTIIFQKTLGDTKDFKNAELYSVQIK